jgi:DNA (cytosine-5)-methyltransferase 1
MRNKSIGSVQLSLFQRTSPSGDSFTTIADKLGCDIKQSAWPNEFGAILSKKFISEKKVITLSLFSGAGGLDIGFHDVGFDIIECVELERKFCDSLRENTGMGKYFSQKKIINCIDIREYRPKGIQKIDFIIGGPPCQTFSAAGRRANGVLGTSDARGILFKEYIRIINDLQPRGFLFENVYGIIGAQGGCAWREILDEFSKIEYKLYFRILDAADYGVPQHRERLIIIGLKDKSFSFPRPTHGPDSIDRSDYYSAELAIETAYLEDIEKVTGINGRYGHLLNGIPPGLNYSFYTEKMGHPQPIFAWRSKFSDFLYKADPNTPVRTIKAQGGQYTGPFHWDNRNFSVSEYKRLQTFPDDYVLSGNRQTQIHQIGNSVPPQLARILAIAIRQQVFDTNFGFTLPYLCDHDQLGFRQRKRQLTEKYRTKASNALENEGPSSPIIGKKSYRYYAIISKDFGLKRTEKEKANFEIDVTWNMNLQIIVNDKGQNKNIPSYSIVIVPNDCGWNLSVAKIVVEAYTNITLGYTVAWKAVEEELIQNNIKADLVQLCGYYQYPPRICCELILQTEMSLFFLKGVVNGKATRRILSEYELANILSIDKDKVFSYAQKMREIGYEIRNYKTNPQIKKGQWLIPYAFPTLAPLSVQLRKSLR